MAVARDRAGVYGVKADFRAMNANEVTAAFGAGAFDCAIFFACLEHMTVAERLASLRSVWEMLPVRGRLAIVETPNRLWHFDNHTSMLPFFHWLPDELAFHYSRFSPRENFRESYGQFDADSEERFLRRGRGMSFHELDLAIGRAEDLEVVSSLSTFQGIRHKLGRSRRDRRYKAMLMRIHPGIHEGFFGDHLYLVIGRERQPSPARGARPSARDTSSNDDESTR